jgi:hypothetical protein
VRCVPEEWSSRLVKGRTEPGLQAVWHSFGWHFFPVDLFPVRSFAGGAFRAGIFRPARLWPARFRVARFRVAGFRAAGFRLVRVSVLARQSHAPASSMVLRVFPRLVGRAIVVEARLGGGFWWASAPRFASSVSSVAFNAPVKRALVKRCARGRCARRRCGLSHQVTSSTELSTRTKQEYLGVIEMAWGESTRCR